MALISLALLGVLFAAGSSSASLFGGLLGPRGDTAQQRRDAVLAESARMLERLYALKPEMRQQVANAAGYATFSRTNIHLFLVASGSGYGVHVNNRTRTNTFMRVAALGGGIGLGVNDLRVVFVFNDPAVMNQFVTQGWQFGGNADATAMVRNTGAASNQAAKANVNFRDGTVATGAGSTVGGSDGAESNTTVAAGGAMQIFQFTETGVSLQATVSGTRFWTDSALNNRR